MVKKKISSNLYLKNINSNFLSPKITASPFMIGNQKLKAPHKINFFPKSSSAKQTPFIAFVPKKSPKFIPPQQFLSPYASKTTKKVKRMDMNWFQAKQKNTRLNPWGDADKDGVINVFDCHPYDPARDGVFSSIGKVASSAYSAVAKAVAPVAKAATTTVTKAYTSVDKAVGGALPGGSTATSSTAKAVEKALTNVVTAPVKAAAAVYTSVDKAVFSGALPGGASVSAPAPVSASTKPIGPTIIPTGGGGDGSSADGRSDMLKTPLNPFTPPIDKKSSESKNGSGSGSSSVANIDKKFFSGGTGTGGGGGGGRGGIPTQTTPFKPTPPKLPEPDPNIFVPPRNPFTTPTPPLPKPRTPPSEKKQPTQIATYDSLTGTYTDEFGNSSNRKEIPSGMASFNTTTGTYIDKEGRASNQKEVSSDNVVILTGGGWRNYNPPIEIKEAPLEIGHPHYYYYPEPEVQYIEPAPATLKDVQAFLQPLSQRMTKPEYDKALPQIAGAVEISPEQLPYVTGDKYAKYPLILNINPMDRKKPAFVTSELMRLNPRITYNRNIPTRLSIIAPIGTTKEVAMTNIGAPGGKFAEYVIKMPSA